MFIDRPLIGSQYPDSSDGTGKNKHDESVIAQQPFDGHKSQENHIELQGSLSQKSKPKFRDFSGSQQNFKELQFLIQRGVSQSIEIDEQPNNRLTGPVQFLVKLLEHWNLKRADAVVLLGFAAQESEHIYRILDGHEVLPESQDIKDRIEFLLSIRKSLWIFFQDIEVENEWLREPQQLLNDQIPMDIMLDGKFENLLLVKEYVDAITGM